MFIKILYHFPFKGITKGSPNFGEIHIWVKECKNLPQIRTTIDPYVKWYAHRILHKNINLNVLLYQLYVLFPPRLKLCATRHEQEESTEDTCAAENSGSGV